jgi:hypothetical protein
MGVSLANMTTGHLLFCLSNFSNLLKKPKQELGENVLPSGYRLNNSPVAQLVRALH